MNYWHMQLHPNYPSWEREKELLENMSLIGRGYDAKSEEQRNFEKVMQIGDIVLIKQGGTIIALVEVTGEYQHIKPKKNDLVWFEHQRAVKVLDWYQESYNYKVSPRNTLTRCNENNSDAETNRNIYNWHTKVKQKQLFDACKTLLEKNYNLILTGAPGTGKTFLAKKIAEQMITESAMNGDFVLTQFHPSYDYTDFVEGLRPHKKTDQSEIGFELKNGSFKTFCKKAKDNPNGKYVFIIDEINRGEISKIFGELFYAIDPGYRGENGKVKTQYSNIQTEETYFTDLTDDRFFVPRNVFIIGTMNDIDRSVESFDFAMRRRFAWKEITPEITKGMLVDLIPDWSGEALIRMDYLNKAIAKVEGLSPAYFIGPAYYLKLKEYNGSFSELWVNHLNGLLMEYLRGMSDLETKMKYLYNAFFQQEDIDENN